MALIVHRAEGTQCSGVNGEVGERAAGALGQVQQTGAQEPCPRQRCKRGQNEKPDFGVHPDQAKMYLRGPQYLCCHCPDVLAALDEPWPLNVLHIIHFSPESSVLFNIFFSISSVLLRWCPFSWWATIVKFCFRKTEVSCMGSSEHPSWLGPCESSLSPLLSLRSASALLHLSGLF